MKTNSIGVYFIVIGLMAGCISFAVANNDDPFGPGGIGNFACETDPIVDVSNGAGIGFEGVQCRDVGIGCGIFRLEGDCTTAFRQEFDVFTGQLWFIGRCVCLEFDEFGPRTDLLNLWQTDN